MAASRRLRGSISARCAADAGLTVSDLVVPGYVWASKELGNGEGWFRYIVMFASFPAAKWAIGLRNASRRVPGLDRMERQWALAGNHFERGLGMLDEKLGGRARRRAVLLLAGCLALGSADVGTIGAVAPQLERAFHVGNVQIGLMVTVSALVAALGMLPVGWITDRRCRTRLLYWSIALWAAAQGLSAVSISFGMLLGARVILGALTATTGPTIASLTGDLFPAQDRSKIYGYIITGELVGAGVGLAIAGMVAAWSSWRVSFIVLAVPSLFLAWAVRKQLPEPARGGQSHLSVGAEELIPADDVAGGGDIASDEDAPPPREDGAVTRAVKRHRIEPREDSILNHDPMTLSWVDATRYVLRVRSNVLLILASTLGYFFFAGLETFALIYLRGHFGIGQGAATLLVILIGAAAVAGAIIGGRYSDSLISKGRIDGRLIVAAVGFLVTAAVLVPGILSPWLALSIPLFLVGGFAMAAPNPGLDAARLDVMPSRMWGRAEAVRSLLRAVGQAFAPLLFGLTSVLFGGTSKGFAESASATNSKVTTTQTTGLEETFVIMLIPLVLAGLIVWRGRHVYPGDVAAATVSEERFPPEAKSNGEPVGEQSSMAVSESRTA